MLRQLLFRGRRALVILPYAGGSFHQLSLFAALRFWMWHLCSSVQPCTLTFYKGIRMLRLDKVYENLEISMKHGSIRFPQSCFGHPSQVSICEERVSQLRMTYGACGWVLPVSMIFPVFLVGNWMNDFCLHVFLVANVSLNRRSACGRFVFFIGWKVLAIAITTCLVSVFHSL